MAGARPLSWPQVSTVAPHLSPPRDTAFFWLCLGTGLRISEACSLSLSDVLLPGGTLADVITYLPAKQRRARSTRQIPISKTLTYHLNTLIISLPNANPYSYLFQSRKGTNAPLTPRHARRVLSHAFLAAGLPPGFSPHSLRKTFAQSVFEASGRDVFLTQLALGHSSPASTVYYLDRDRPRVHAAIVAVLDDHLPPDLSKLTEKAGALQAPAPTGNQPSFTTAPANHREAYHPPTQNATTLPPPIPSFPPAKLP